MSATGRASSQMIWMPLRPTGLKLPRKCSASSHEAASRRPAAYHDSKTGICSVKTLKTISISHYQGQDGKPRAANDMPLHCA